MRSTTTASLARGARGVEGRPRDAAASPFDSGDGARRERAPVVGDVVGVVGDRERQRGVLETGGGERAALGEDHDMGAASVAVCGRARDWDALAGDNFYSHKRAANYEALG